MIAGLTYHASLAREWDQAVGASRNGTFLLRRPFMDYHADRFEDHSLLFTSHSDDILGLLPAHIRREQQLTISHGGLTYGGLVLSPKATLTDVRDMFVQTAHCFLAEGCRQLIYKPIPHIYHAYPTQEDLYWLFRARHVSSRGPWPAPLTCKALWPPPCGTAKPKSKPAKVCK